MALIESRPSSLIRIELVFIRPFPGTNITEFAFQPANDSTLVTWKMSGKNNFIAKAVGLFLDVDKLVGSQFEEGLANLQAVVAQ